MKELLITATQWSVVIIDMMALITIVAGTIEAFFGGAFVLLSSGDGHRKREVWLRYGRWLVAGLTFQLAADIIETAIAPSWDDIGKLAVIAIIRTFLNYFLERDMTDIREREAAKRASK